LAVCELVRHNDALQLLNSLTERLHRTLDLELIAREAIEVVGAFCDAQLATFHLYDTDRDQARLVAHFGIDAQQTDVAGALVLAGSLAASAAAEKRLLISANWPADQRLEPGVRDALLPLRLRSLVSVPFLYLDSVLGVINLGYRQARTFDALDRETLTSAGQNIALAVANATHLASLEHQAMHDSLTGLPNRAFLHNECARLKKDRRAREQQFALLLFDIDRFREINDTLGHHVGDELLIRIGQRVQTELFNERALFCRLGGDEFALVLALDDGVDEALRAADELLSTLSRPFTLGNMTLGICASIGLALFPRHAADSHELLRCADVAMYQAKHSSASLAVYDRTLDQHSPDRLSLMVELGAAIQEDQLTLHFQPKINLLDQRVTGFEALVRWNHQRLGLIRPDQFIPLVEMSDLIHSLTGWVIDKALAQLRTWWEEGMEVGVAINISTRNLLDQSFCDTLSQLIRVHDVDPRFIELELTETALIGDPARVQASLNQIAALGLALSIDDFGTGYSSLSYLKRLPMQSLKIDRSFVSEMLQDQQDLVIVRSTINLAKNLGLDVAAEGVEDQAVFETLRGMGCDFAQGDYVSAPLAGEAVEQWWKTRC
jgi:diguanylate cyclase (GGDEF)-like protein